MSKTGIDFPHMDWLYWDLDDCIDGSLAQDDLKYYLDNFWEDDNEGSEEN